MLTAGAFVSASAFLLAAIASIYGQRIMTIQLDGVQYFISRMNPYSPELNYFLAYQYCRSIGLQLASFESQEKADSMMQYLRNAGYNGHDYWTSGNRLGNDMLIWMSSGVTFNATFNYMRKAPSNELDHSTTNGPADGEPSPAETSASGQAKNPSARRGWRRQSREGYLKSGCVALKAPELEWVTDDCDEKKDFICEQTRCYYYNYGSIPVSTAQGNRKKQSSTTTTEAASTDTSNNASTTHTPPLASNDYHQDQEEEDYPQLGPLLNFTVNRRITLRPSAGDQTAPTTTSTTETPSNINVTETPVEGQAGRTYKKDVSTQSQEGFSGRSIFNKDTDTNVVYVTAVGASDDQQAIAYLNTDVSSTDLPTTQPQEDESDHTVIGNPDASTTGTHGKVLDPLPINKYVQEHGQTVPSHVY